MTGKIPNEEGLTEDEIARRKLGPRGVPGGGDSAKMTPQQKKNLPKEGEFDGHVACLRSAESAQSLPQCVSSSRFSKFSSLGRNLSEPSLARNFDITSLRLF